MPGNPLFKATFDGWLEKLTYFLNQVWNYFERYGAAYPDKVACINDITLNLEGEATEWVVFLHNEGTPVLGNVDAFMEELQTRVRDPALVH
ncbi:hypothetical protein E2320_007855 [Naja naja]|nr:hypothetical protein E2320_007855 [Naja naja]